MNFSSDQILDQLSFYCIVIDADFNFVYINNVQPGIDKNTLIGQSVFIGVDDNEKSRVSKIYNGILKSGSPASFVMEAATGPGTIGCYQVFARKISESGKNFILIISHLLEDSEVSSIKDLNSTGSQAVLNHLFKGVSFDEASQIYLQSKIEESNGTIKGENGAAARAGLNPATFNSKLKKLNSDSD